MRADEWDERRSKALDEAVHRVETICRGSTRDFNATLAQHVGMRHARRVFTTNRRARSFIIL